jgi:hypothetical protein
VVFVDSVFVLVEVPYGVSTRSVVVVRERSTVGSGGAGAAGGFTIVVEEVEAGGEAGTSRCTTVSFVGWTMVVEVLAGRSQPASAARARAIAVGRTYFFIEVSMEG